ncbi:MAG: hypothetical protein EBR82_44600 [Caulobacteraceae bacterium]|nr:hypothetical protein [Caulobacteraceae bacterium]
MKNLTELANAFNSDKGDRYKCAHSYTRHYQKLFESYRDWQDFSLLEIGLNRDGTDDVPSLRMYREFFGPNARICGMDIRPEFSRFENDGFTITIGDQGLESDVAKCAESSYSIVIDDGSHASSHQQITLHGLWKAVAPGGLYIIEDLHWQPFAESIPSTKSLCQSWLQGIPAASPFISKEWAEQFIEELANAELLPSFSTLHNANLTSQALFVAQKK